MKQYPEKIVSECFIGTTGVDETTSLQLTYDNGVVSQTVCSFRSQMVNDLFIYGDKGHIRIHPDFWGSETASLVTQEKTTIQQCPFDINGFEYQIRHAEQCIKMGKLESDIMSHNRTLSALKLMDTVKSQHQNS
jgi:predicted dehydrogenase